MRNTSINITLSVIFVLLTFNVTVYSDDIASTPKTHYACTWEPYTFDIYSYNKAISTYDADKFEENLSVYSDYSQGYVVHRYQHYDPEDDSFDYCTRQNWDYLAVDTGILLLNTHGNYFSVAGAYTKDPDMIYDENNSPHGWADGDNDGNDDNGINPVDDNSGFYYANVLYYWLSENFQETLEYNNAIVFYCSCASADPGHWSETPLCNCYGAIGFGYPGTAGEDEENENIERLLSRMNGRVFNMGYRDAQNVYGCFTGDWKENWTCRNPFNNKITLCPIVKEAKLYPDYGNPIDITIYYSSGAGWSGSGHIQFDTHCQTVDAPAAAVYSSVTGSGYIYNQTWYDDHTITFDYCCDGSYSLTLMACPYYIHGSSLGTLNLDGNRVAPNDDYYWTGFSN